MKKLLKSFTACVSVAFLLASCSSHSPETISEGEILDEFNRLLKEDAKDVVFTSVEVGTYECNDESAREHLRKLQVAGLITYDVERLAWWEKSFKSVKRYRNVTEYIGWYSYQTQKAYWTKETVYDFEDHYIVTVALTNDGEKIAVAELPKKVEDEALKQPEINTEEYAWNVADLTEEWPVIENPFIEKSKPESEPESAPDSVVSVEVKEPVKEPEAKDDTPKIERNDKAMYEKYIAISPSRETIYLKAFEVKGTDARYISLTKNEKGESIVEAEVIYATKNVTDAGRIAFGAENNFKHSEHVSLLYYLDKGWVINNKISEE